MESMNSMDIVTDYKNFQIGARYLGDKCWPAFPENSNNHIVLIKNTETGETIQFSYWESIAIGKIQTREQLLEAFGAFVDDAICGYWGFDEFCDEFGYDKENFKKNINIYNKCVETSKKARNIGFDTEESLCDFVNELRRHY